MFILTLQKGGGVYSVKYSEKSRTVQCFVDREDAERYQGLLEANEYKHKLNIMEVDGDIIALNCDNYGYNYTIIQPDDFVIPPHIE